MTVAGSARDELWEEARNSGGCASLGVISVKNVIWHLRYLGRCQKCHTPYKGVTPDTSYLVWTFDTFSHFWSITHLWIRPASVAARRSL